MTIVDIDDFTCRSIAYSLSHLMSVVEHLEPSWTRAFLKRARFLDPDFQGDVLAVISASSFSPAILVALLISDHRFDCKCSYDILVSTYRQPTPTSHAVSVTGQVHDEVPWLGRNTPGFGGGLWVAEAFDVGYVEG